MYAISEKIRKYSPTPIVKVTVVDGKKTEEIVLISSLKKKEGDALSETIVRLLNEQEKTYRYIPIKETLGTWQEEFDKAIADGTYLNAMKIYKDNTGSSLLEAKTFVKSLIDKK